MPDPQTKQPEIRHKLAEYLTQETTQFYSDINWLYYYQEHDSSMSPMGAIFIDRVESGNNNYPLNLDNPNTSYKIHVRVKISKDTLLELLDSLDNWAAYLKNTVFKKLQCEGYQGFFKGMHLDPGQEIVIQVDKNQDGGGCGNLHVFLVWNDQGIVTGNQIGAFL